MLKINRQFKSNTSLGYAQNTNRDNSAKIEMKDGIFAQQFKQSYGTQLEKEIGDLILELDLNGKKFAEHPSEENLFFYKRNVQSFFKFIARHAFSIKDIYGRRVDYKLVNTINQKLEDLSDQVKSREFDRLTLLSQIDEIKGLIFDMVF